MNHDAAVRNHQVARENRAARLVPEHDVIGRVAGRVQRRQLVSAEVNHRERQASGSQSTPYLASSPGHGYLKNAAPGYACRKAAAPDA